MKILFVIPACDRENLGILGLVRFLKDHGYSVGISLLDEKKIGEFVLKENYDTLAYYTLSVYSRYLLKLNRSLKSQFPRTLSLFGGPHPTFFPEMIEEEGVDGICLGEGEHALLDLARNLSEGKPITHIQNWWIKQEGKIYRNPLRPLIEDLNSLPFPDRSFSDRIISFKMGRASVITSRGCPYQCSYCFNHAYNRLYNNTPGKVRRRSVDNVIEEIKQLKQGFPLKMVIFQDDTFILDRGWLEEFSSKYKKEIGVPFSCFVRADIVSREVVVLLKDAGCVIMNMGIECADDYTRNEILKRNMDRQTILDAAFLIKKEGICLRTTNILGIPGSSLESDFETLQLNIKCKPDYARANILSAYPNTDIYACAQEINFTGKNFECTTSGGNQSLRRKHNSRREQRKLENLSCLFSLFVRFPFLASLSAVLIEFPLNTVFSKMAILNLIHQLYFYKIKGVNDGSLVKRIARQRKIFKDILSLYTTSYVLKKG